MNQKIAMVDLLKNPNQPLRDDLFDSYIINTAQWLLRPTDSPYLLAQSANSNWECALSTEFLLFIINNIEEKNTNYDALQSEIEENLYQTITWMAGQVEEVQFDGRRMAHWDGVTYDTAVCARASLKTLDKFPERFSQRQKENIIDTIRKTLSWLAFTFDKWEDDIKYSYGPVDISQIVITTCEISNQRPELLSSSIDPYFSNPDEFIEKMIEYLLSYGEELEVDFDRQNTNSQTITYWGNPFQSAGVIDGLTKYISQCKQGMFDNPQFQGKCENAVSGSISYIEDQQNEGKWGSHADTCRILYAYLRAAKRMDNIQPEPHITFKSIRWLCDEKQTFSDGSYLHTTFLTVYYALALKEVYENWPLAKEPTIQVLDDAMWASPVRSSQERTQRLQLEVKHNDLEDRHTKIRNRYALSTGIATFGFVIILSITFGMMLGWISVGDISITDLLTYYGALVLVVGLASVSAIYNYLSNPDDKFRL